MADKTPKAEIAAEPAPPPFPSVVRVWDGARTIDARVLRVKEDGTLDLAVPGPNIGEITLYGVHPRQPGQGSGWELI